MNVTHGRTGVILEALQEKHNAEWCCLYGEPGYETRSGVILCNWNYVSKRIYEYLEAAGFSPEWSDEWWIDGDASKAYRTQADSYCWRPTAVFDGDGGMITPDNGAEEAIEAFAADSCPIDAVPYWVTDADLEAAGFVLHSKDNEAGFHPGQTDDPNKIAAELLKKEARRVVGRVDGSGQFDVRFSVWYEPAEAEETEEQE